MNVLVRAPGSAFRQALSEHPERHRIDPERAVAQHRGFVAALVDAGIRVVQLPPEPNLPDAAFVSDTLLALPRADDPGGRTALLVVARPGAASRRPEVESVAAAARGLVPAQADEVEIEDPGTLEGGDIVVFGDRVAIGVSGRSNVCGAGQLALAVQSAGYRAFLCPVTDRLHLASGVTAIGPRRLVGTAAGFASLDAAGPDVAPGQEVERILVPDGEPGGANVLALGGRCIMATGNPVTAAALRAAGESVVEIDLEEFARADGGPTCLVTIVP
jgi:dimethylargininase